jgi:hypothetical protein
LIKNGHGKQMWPDGTSYVGHWQEDRMHGQGSIVYSNQDEYTGEFLNNKANGFGKYTKGGGNGEMYEGFLKEDQPHGQGT